MACCGQLENSISGLPISLPSTLPHSARHSRLPGEVSLGPVQITFLTGSPLTVNSSLHVPSLSVGLTYTKGSWWIVTIWEKDKNQPGPPALGCPQGWRLLGTQQPLVSIFRCSGKYTPGPCPTGFQRSVHILLTWLASVLPSGYGHRSGEVLKWGTDFPSHRPWLVKVPPAMLSSSCSPFPPIPVQTSLCRSMTV